MDKGGLHKREKFWAFGEKASKSVQSYARCNAQLGTSGEGYFNSMSANISTPEMEL